MIDNSKIGYINQIESFALVDGPGVRSVLFMQGCPFRCLYCHNPDTWEFNKSNCITPSEALNKLIRYKPYWKDNGGITISGGEPLAQLDFLIEFSKLCKENNINVTLDTAGSTFRLDNDYIVKFNELLKYIDLIMLDIKVIDNDLHKTITGHDNSNVLDMFKHLSSINFPIWIRYVLLPGYTDDINVLNETKEFISKLKNVKRVEVLPYHTLGTFKYDKLGIEYKLKGVNVPSEESINLAKSILENI